jgi:hypothetical protein
VVPQSKARRAPHGSGAGFGGMGGRGETRQENKRLRICGYADKCTKGCTGLKTFVYSGKYGFATLIA